MDIIFIGQMKNSNIMLLKFVIVWVFFCRLVIVVVVAAFVVIAPAAVGVQPVGSPLQHLFVVEQIFFESPNDVAVEVGRMNVGRRIFFEGSQGPVKGTHNEMEPVKSFLQANVHLFLVRFGMQVKLQKRFFITAKSSAERVFLSPPKLSVTWLCIIREMMGWSSLPGNFCFPFADGIKLNWQGTLTT
jgi:hypothetical protein